MIPLTVLYQTDFVVIEVNQELQYFQVTWLQQPSSALFRKETTMVAEYALEHNFTKSLFDVRKRDFLEVSDQNWLVRDLFPIFKGRNIKLAYLVSAIGLEIMDTFQIHNLIINNPELKRHVEIDIFLDKEDALKWLLELKYTY